MPEEQVILVDKKDKQIGLMEKMVAHKGKGHLHRAISVLLYRTRNGKTEVLLQQRSKSKPLWPFFWSNTVCGNVLKGETYRDTASRRLKDELGIEAKNGMIKPLYKFQYQAKYDEQFGENELDQVFVGELGQKFQPNPDEVSEIKWLEWKELKKNINRARKYTPWLKKMTQSRKLQDYFNEREVK